MIKIGEKITLTVDAEDPSGYYLVCEENKEAFMPGSLAKKKYKIGEQVEVCVFIDSNNEEIATPNLPHAFVGDLAILEVTDIAPQGAYLDIGLPKDLLVPSNLQKHKMEIGEKHLVKVLMEEEKNRLYGSSKIDAYVKKDDIQLTERDLVSVIPYYKTRLGYKVLINNEYLGMIYHDEIFNTVVTGQTYEGSIKRVRHDGLIDVILGKTGVQSLAENEEKLLEHIKAEGGFLALTDKSSPEDIKSSLSMSKSSFKKAVGTLYKKRLITIEEKGLKLTDHQQVK